MALAEAPERAGEPQAATLDEAEAEALLEATRAKVAQEYAEPNAASRCSAPKGVEAAVAGALHPCSPQCLSNRPTLQKHNRV